VCIDSDASPLASRQRRCASVQRCAQQHRHGSAIAACWGAYEKKAGRGHDSHDQDGTGLRQGLGHGAARRVQPWLAAQRGRVGGPMCFWLPTDTAASRTIAAAMADRASRGPATTWTRTPTISRRSSTRSISATGPRRPFHGRRRSRQVHRPHGTTRSPRRADRTVTPLMLQTAAIPLGCRAEFDDIPPASRDRSQFFKESHAPFTGANRPGAKVSQGLRDAFWLQGMRADSRASSLHHRFRKQTYDDLGRSTCDADPAWRRRPDRADRASARLTSTSSRLDTADLRGRTHGLCSTHKDQVNADCSVPQA